MKVLALYQDIVDDFSTAGIDDPEIEAALLLGHFLNMNRAEIILAGEMDFPEDDLTELASYVARRLKREPLAHIIGECEFWSLPFAITRDVLVPRQETELLIERALALSSELPNTNAPVLDMGTGSGIIPVVLAKEIPDRKIFALDLSFAALEVAAFNAAQHNVRSRIHFINSDWLAGFVPRPCFAMIVSNPPYIASEDIPRLQPEVSYFEPLLALNGGEKGLEVIAGFFEAMVDMLKPGGGVLLEIGYDQEEQVRTLFETSGRFDGIAVHRDYAGIPRVLEARKRT